MTLPLDPARALAATRLALVQHGDVCLPIAGAFVLLPQLAALLLGLKPPATTEAMMAALTAAPVPLLAALLVPALIGLIADLAIARLIIGTADGEAPTGRAALAAALAAWPRLLMVFALLMLGAMLLALIVSPLGLTATIIVALPLMLLVMARTLPLIPLFAAEPLAPVAALRRCWALGVGNGWALLAVTLALRIVLLLISGFATMIGNGLGTLLGRGWGLGHFIEMLLPAAAVTAMSVVVAVLVSHIYLQLRGGAR